MQMINTVGRRKTAIARVYLKDGKGKVTVNGRPMEEFLPIPTLQAVVNQAFKVTETEGKFDVQVNSVGGGIKGQAEAIRLGIARALVELNSENKPVLRKHGLLTRDDRMVERKKYGRRKARRRFQFSKR